MTDLLDHESECPCCYGSTRDSDLCESDDHEAQIAEDGLCPECPECHDCDGSGEVTWAWRHEVTEACDVCTKAAVGAVTTAHVSLPGYAFIDLERARAKAARDLPEVPCDRWGEDGDKAVCLPCALAQHARMCGCDKWPKGVAK